MSQKWVALFPGQGSQHPEMGKFLYEEFPIARQTFEEGSDALSLDLKKLCFSGSEADLALTENTQPALLLVSVASWRVLQQELGFSVIAGAGHSIGEYAAVVSAGALDFATAIRAVRVRGQAMQAAVPVGVGGMSAVLGLELPQVEELCRWAEKGSGDQPVSPANLNAPGQIVISGKKAVLDWAAANLKAELFPGTRVKLLPLKVSAPFHCALMKPAEDKMATVLGDASFKMAAFPIVQNVNAQAIVGGEELRVNLVKQVSAPVRWIECVRQLIALGGERAVEVGCGRVLNGLVKKIDSERLPTFNINSLSDIKALENQLKGE